ncbi:MAG: MATE family efflux transporter [Candidatus Delongbacteria bacterium]|nr:MATE family efflux transporter [Candidatus Delongbacteria bacterium]MBN2833346.1 MATE family efflux transporter [Candidatus Delongbacteria bacterium]
MKNYIKYMDNFFWKRLIVLAVPIALQNLLMSSINLADVFMIGQLGEESIAATGLANQITFLFILMLFGIGSGAGIFTAQFWGKGDLKGVHNTLGISLILSMIATTLFGTGAFFFPEYLMKIYTTDSTVVSLGSTYLVYTAISFFFTAFSFVYSLALRSIERTMLPMYASIFTLITNVTLDYCLIFGKFGFPEMGVKGAAIATSIARFVEFVIIVGVIYLRKYPLASSLSDLVKIPGSLFSRYIKVSSPVILNEVLWSLGISTYNIIYGRMGTEAVASVNIENSIERLAFVVMIGIGSATATMVGNRIGAKEEERAFAFGNNLAIIGVLSGILISIIMVLIADPVLSIFKVSESVMQNSKNILYIFAAILPFKAFNTIHIIGSLRAGGDTKYCLILDLSALWFLGIPLSFYAAFYLDWSVYMVFMMASTEEIIKFVLILKRFYSGKWMKNLVHDL